MPIISSNIESLDYLASTERYPCSQEDVPVEILSADRSRARNLPAGVSNKAIAVSPQHIDISPQGIEILPQEGGGFSDYIEDYESRRQ